MLQSVIENAIIRKLAVTQDSKCFVVMATGKIHCKLASLRIFFISTVCFIFHASVLMSKAPCLFHR